MIIQQATFVKSSSKLADCPSGDYPEYAFIGRSNVGKSSLINMLTGRSKLALTGNTPGKTVLINHFLINEEWYLVDLPGYGYARRGMTQRETFKRLITSYIFGREQLANLFLLVDIRIPPQPIDLDFIQQVGERGIPFSIVFTKIDKLSQRQQAEALSRYKAKLAESWEELPPIFTVSSIKQQGREALLSYIEEINRTLA